MVDFSAGSLRVAIIGLGPRGLTVLERIFAMAKFTQNMRPIEVKIFEPQRLGCGAHGQDDPDYLLLNTVAGQLTIYPSSSSYITGKRTVLTQGPTFLEWCHINNIHIDAHGHSCETGGRSVEFDDFLPRRLLSDYLHDAYQRISQECPSNVSVQVISQTVDKITPHVGCTGYEIICEQGDKFNVYAVVLTTGHGIFRAEPDEGADIQRIQNVYPLPDSLSSISSTDTVALEGFGLVAQDVLAALTQGRGGVLISNEDRTTYKPSGNEPKIILYSRTGLPFRVRPNISREWKKHMALVMTPAHIDEVRKQKANNKIDFIQDILPLMLLEMRAAYHITTSRIAGNPMTWETLKQENDHGNLLQALSGLDERFGVFDPYELIGHDVNMTKYGSDYPFVLRQWIEADLDEARKGLNNSPVKSALEVWRDLRDNLRYALDFDSMTESSLNDFYLQFNGAINRMVAGPQKERHQDLLAFIDAGIVCIAPGTAPQVQYQSLDKKFLLNFTVDNTIQSECVDWIIHAHLNNPTHSNKHNDIIAALISGELLKSCPTIKGLGCIHVDQKCRAFNCNGDVNNTFFVLGVPVEGRTYYNHYVPSPDGISRGLEDAHTIGATILRLAQGMNT